MYEIDLSTWWRDIVAVPSDAHPLMVFDLLASRSDWSFLPVVDGCGRPLGVVREQCLRQYAFSRFGRELIQRRPLSDFVEPSLVVPGDIGLDELLGASVSNPNPEGLLVTVDGVYRAVLLNDALLKLQEERHVETMVRLANAQKMEAIGTLAGGIAHDLNNMLTPILGYAELLRDAVADQRVAVDFVDQLTVCAQRASQTVKQVLAFSRQQSNERCLTRLSDAVREVTQLVRSSLPATIDIELALETLDDTVLVSPTELHQVLMNLCTNAFHAMQERGGRLRLGVTDHNGALLGWSALSGDVPSGLIRLSVSDTGCGIESALLARIFEPFFTTKPQGEGTGMGLAIVHGIVSRAQGFVSVESAADQGTSVHIYLPRQQAVGDAPGVPRIVRPAPSATPTGLVQVLRVLVVDDEVSITRLAREVLSRHGFQVTTQNDARAALNLLSADPGAFDVVLTDHMMPELTGLDLARRALALRPGLPVLLCTGYTEAVSPEQVHALGLVDLLLKPLDFTQVAALLRHCCEHTEAVLACA
jgi:signal transduction histidine kinase/ActR/RegA family two-component response regulator